MRVLVGVVVWALAVFWVYCIVRSGAQAEVDWRSNDLARWREKKRVGLP